MTFQMSASGIEIIYLATVREADEWDEAGFSSLEAVCPIWLRNLFQM